MNPGGTIADHSGDTAAVRSWPAANPSGPRGFARVIGVWNAFWYAILPDRCVGCRTPLSRNTSPFFCDPCRLSLTAISGPQCPRCGVPFPSRTALVHSPSHICGSCRTRKPSYERAWSLYAYESPLREAIHGFKYRRNLAMGRVLGRLLTQALPPGLDVDVVMPVPLAPPRLREREYNQSLILARHAATALGRPLDCLSLIRASGSPPQTSLRRRARLQNLRRTFQVSRTDEVHDKRILLIDDVLTTGTTVNECAKALRKAGSGPVFVVTLARTIA